MRRIMKMILLIALFAVMTVPAFAEKFAVDMHARMDGMSCSWYQGYTPSVSGNTMYLSLPLRAETLQGDITASLSLEDPDVFLLSGQPRAVTVSQKDGIYPVKLSIPLQNYRRNGDFPAVITVKGTDAAGKEIMETIPYTIRIRDGYDASETLKPVVSNVAGELEPGCAGSLTLTITNPTTTISMVDGVLTVTDATGEVLMDGSDRFAIPEIQPGKSETLTLPMTVKGSAAISLHTLTVKLQYKALDTDATWTENFTIPVTQSIRLEQGGVKMPIATAGELTDMTLPLMNMGKGELRNVLVKLEMDGVLDAQSVLVGTVPAGESKLAKLTFAPQLDAVGTHSGTVTVTCEDAYGNEAAQTLDVTLIVKEPIPQVTEEKAEQQKKMSVGTILLIVLSVALTAALVAQSVLLHGKLHKLEEERL